ncbi:MAG: 50S ribosomal protein L25 [Candidatus Saccharimonadales bacterium]
MSNEEIGLVLKEREVVGKQVKQLRRDGSIPAVIHDHGKPSVIVMAPVIEITKAYHAAGKHHPINLSVGQKKYLAIIKDVDFEPKKHQLRHVVFNAIKTDQKVQTEVPIHLEGEIPAEKAGLMVITNLDTVEIEALPKDLVDEFKVSAIGLAEIGDKLTVADLKVPEGVVILTEAEHPIATVEETKEQISEAAEEEVEGETEGEAGAEGEGGDKPKESGEDE